MTEEEFSTLPTAAKWEHVRTTMNYITNMDARYENIKDSYDLRRRLNPHHSDEYVKLEEKEIKHKQRNLRIDQYQRWTHVKNLYAAHRDEMVNTFENPLYEECKSVLERIFTMEVDDALRNVLED